MSELDDAAEALTAARRALEYELLIVCAYLKLRAKTGDKLAAHLSERVDAAFDRSRVEGIAAKTVASGMIEGP
jgi:hypothetical protein